MPIHKLSEHVRYVRTGKIKIGKRETFEERNDQGQVVAIHQRPVALDHFRIVGGEYAVQQAYGEEPRELLVYLPFRLSPMVWDANWKRYGKSGLLCKGDGLVGYEAQRGVGLQQRDCADRGCPFAQSTQSRHPTTGQVQEQPAACRIVGQLNLKIVGVPSAGVFALELRGSRAVSETQAFLEQLEEAAGGSLAGIPFRIRVERTTLSSGNQISSVRFYESEETQKALLEHRRISAPVAIERASGYLITDEEGKLIATPELSEGRNVRLVATFAERLQYGIDRSYLVGKAREAYQELFLQLGNLSDQEIETRLEQLEAWLANFEATQHQPASQHPPDQAMAAAVFRKLKSRDYQALQFAAPPSALELTRIQIRLAVRYLEARSKSGRAA